MERKGQSKVNQKERKGNTTKSTKETENCTKPDTDSKYNKGNEVSITVLLARATRSKDDKPKENYNEKHQR